MVADLEGECACGAVRYRLAAAPMFVHCCHCRNCQRQTGSAFVLNALLEADRVTLLSGNPEAKIAPGWADAIGRTAPEDTTVTRAFSGRPGRSIATAYVRAAAAPIAPPPAPYPVQRGLTAAMRSAAAKNNDAERMQMWAGQSAGLTKALPAADVVRALWDNAQDLLS